MQQTDYEVFSDLIADVHAFYKQEVSRFGLNVWWQSMKPFSFQAVSSALNRHCMNPDSGQFMPKPADVVKMLQGSSADSALQAWSKVDYAVRHVGTNRSVAFDDPLIHVVIQEMGGWVPLGRKTEDEWVFVAKEFSTRYRGYKMRNDLPEYRRYLIGESEAQNNTNGYKSQPPMLIGREENARQVMLGGQDTAGIGFKDAGDVLMKAIKNKGAE